MLLQHDPIFFSIKSGFMPSIDEEKVTNKSCIMQPKKVEVLEDSKAIFEPIADFSVLMMLLVSWDNDFDGNSGVRNRLFNLIFKGVFRVFIKRIEAKGIMISKLKNDSLMALEMERARSSTPLERLKGFVEFGGKLTKIFFDLGSNYKRGEIIAGEMLKVMYLVDALEDFHQDSKKKRFNILHEFASTDITKYVEDGVFKSLEMVSSKGKLLRDPCFGEITASSIDMVVGSLIKAKEEYCKGGRDA